MNIKDITPKKYKCVAAACPSVYVDEDSDKLIIIGDEADIKELGISEDNVGDNEKAIIVDKEMLRQVD